MRKNEHIITLCILTISHAGEVRFLTIMSSVQLKEFKKLRNNDSGSWLLKLGVVSLLFARPFAITSLRFNTAQRFSMRFSQEGQLKVQITIQFQKEIPVRTRKNIRFRVLARCQVLHASIIRKIRPRLSTMIKIDNQSDHHRAYLRGVPGRKKENVKISMANLKYTANLLMNCSVFFSRKSLQ